MLLSACVDLSQQFGPKPYGGESLQHIAVQPLLLKTI